MTRRDTAHEVSPRPPRWSIACLIVSFSMLVSCEQHRQPESNPGSLASGTVVRARPDSVVTDSGLDSLPPAVREALNRGASSFEAWQLANYPDSIRSVARTMGGTGLSVIHGHFRDSTTIDYIVAGFNHDAHGIRVVALLADTTGAFRVLDVSGGPDRPDSLQAVPDRFLTVYDAAPEDFVLHLFRGSAVIRDERYSWVPERGEFLIWTPN